MIVYDQQFFTIDWIVVVAQDTYLLYGGYAGNGDGACDCASSLKGVNGDDDAMVLLMMMVFIEILTLTLFTSTCPEVIKVKVLNDDDDADLKN